MKIAGVVDEAIVSGMESVIEFKINATAKSFKILSSQIYTDKLGTAPRELGANAVDAHKEAGTNEPFIVHLPNEFEPFYTIRDFGTGMSRKKIETLYTTYFASDKSDTNDLIGGLGLGSKSPFCYTDQFTVISYFNGKKFVYSAFLENGLPKIAFIAEDETKERNGMEISFPIKKQDIHNFNARAKEIYSYFKLKPIIKGVHGFSFKETKYTLVSPNGWALREVDSVNDTRAMTALALMGNIGYPISRYSLTHANFSHKELAVFDCPFDIDFKIGELEIVASREALEYDDRTIKVLKKKVESILEELKDLVQLEFDKCKTRFEAHCVYGDFFGSYGGSNSKSRTLAQLLSGTEFSWMGIPIRTASLQFMKGADEADDLGADEINVFRYYLSTNRAGNEVAKSQEVHQVSCRRGMNSTFFVKDLKVGSVARIRHHIKKEDADVEEAFLVVFNHPTARARFVKNLCIQDSDLKGASVLVRPPRKATSTTGKKLKKVLIYNGGTSRSAGYNWTDGYVELDDTTKCYYVKTMSKTLDYSAYSGTEVKQLASIQKFLQTQGITVDKIYGVSSYKQIEKKKNWVDFIEFAKKEISKLVKSKNLEEMYADYKVFKDFQTHSGSISRDNQYLNVLWRYVTNLKRPVKSDTFNKLIARIEFLKKHHDDFIKIIPDFDSISAFLVQIRFSTNHTPKDTADSIKKDFYKSFPMIAYLDSYAIQNDTTAKETVLSYIENLS